MSLNAMMCDMQSPNPFKSLDEKKAIIERYVQDLLDMLQELQGVTDESRYSEMLNLAHHAWSIAVCAMHGMPIPASWGNAVEKGLRERGIDVDKLPYVVPDAALGDEECEPTEEYTCNVCGQDLVAYGVGVWANGGAIELYPPILFNYCPNCGKAVKQ